jgi:hypothetical protein
MFKQGDKVKVVDFSRDYPDTPMDVLASDHPYRKLGEGECIVLEPQFMKHVLVENIKYGIRKSIYAWRCILAKALEPDWEV